MTNAKYTPGPWKISLDSVVTRLFGRETLGGSAELIAEIRFHSKKKSNGRLLAAAPVLLAACQTAFDALESAAAKDPNGPQAKALAQLRTAIYTAIPE